MRYLLLSFLLAAGLTIPAMTLPVIAQTPQEIEIQRELGRAQRKAIVAQNMGLTEPQAELFWPVYEQYRERVDAQLDKATRAVIEHAPHWQKLSESEAETVIGHLLEADMRLVQLRKDLKSELSAVLPANVTLRYLQIDSRLDMLLRAQISSNVPLVGMQPVMIGDPV